VDASPRALAALGASAFVVVACFAAPLSSASCARRQISVFSCAGSTAKLHRRRRILRRHVDGALQIDGRVRIVDQHLIRVAARLERIDVAGGALIIGVASSTAYYDSSKMSSRSMRCSRSSGESGSKRKASKKQLPGNSCVDPITASRLSGFFHWHSSWRLDVTLVDTVANA
jgi:hypothetical protein